MATRRKQIIDGLVTEIGQTVDVHENNVYKYGNDIDDDLTVECDHSDSKDHLPFSHHEHPHNVDIIYP